MILNLVVVLIVFGIVFSYLVERKCLLGEDNILIPVWAVSLYAVFWTVELGIVIRRCIYGIVEGTTVVLVLCSIMLIFRIPIMIGCFVTMKERKEQEEEL